ncbi:MAG TPA: 4Fe-4S binding protein [Anaerolineae bacterium]|nr:4Fe-4S binding protein [Anaerolineae bacterium]
MKKIGRITAIVAAVLLPLMGWLFLNRKESTVKLSRFHGRRIFDFIHGYLYFKWTSVYLRPVKFVLEHPGLFPGWIYNGAGKRLMQTHHSKVVTVETAKRLVSIEEPIISRNPEQVLPFERARDIILQNPGSIAVTACACRQLSKDPCGPIDVCFVLGEPFVEFVTEHKKEVSRRVSVPEALEILEREHEKGRVHTAWFKDAAGDRLYSICNCCSCCCLGLNALSHGFGVVASSGYIARVNEDACALCGSCDGVCQFGALDALGPQVRIDDDKCMGCGVCVKVCPEGAISLQEDGDKPGPLVLP